MRYLVFLLLAGCAHVPSSCISKHDYERLKQAEPSKIHDKLTGDADKDIRPITGSNIELRSWGETLLGTLEICSRSPAS